MMQHQFWITKQTLSRKFGRKEDECIVASDAELDAKLELFRNIQESCALIQRIIDKYQESICYLSQEASAMGRFLKENAEEDKTRAGDAMLNIGKSLIYFAQQQLILHEPLMRFYQELETFRQRAIGDTLQNVMAMEKGRTEYRAALSWMKNVSQQLDPDTTKQLEKFKKVQDQVRRGKMNFDKLAYDCLQKVDLLAAARCNMLNHTLNFYQNKFIDYTSKTAKSYAAVAKSFDIKHEDRTSDKVFSHSKINKTDSNVKKKPNKEESLISENEATLIDNISTANLVDSSFEQLTNENSSSSETSKLLSKSQSERYSELHDVLMSECNDIFNDISLGEFKSTETSKIDCNIDDDDSFLPSALLKQSLNNVTNGSKLDNKSSKDKGSSDLLSKHNTKSWLNLFEELDPLSQNRSEKSTKTNSFV